MPAHEEEQVLVVPRAILNQIGTFEGFRHAELDDALATLFDPQHQFFMKRSLAEQDPSHKQLIPYCLFRCGSRLLHYTRGKAGSESRLHAKISVGVGGHINPVDTENGKTGAEAYLAAVSREIREELHLKHDYQHRIIGLLNDDANPVGQVHLGVVHLVDLPSEEVISREDALLDLGFSELQVLAGPMFDRLETWSQFCVGHLAGNL